MLLSEILLLTLKYSCDSSHFVVLIPQSLCNEVCALKFTIVLQNKKIIYSNSRWHSIIDAEPKNFKVKETLNIPPCIFISLDLFAFLDCLPESTQTKLFSKQIWWKFGLRSGALEDNDLTHWHSLPWLPKVNFLYDM